MRESLRQGMGIDALEATISEQAQTIASLQQQDRIKTQEINLAVKGYRELEAENLELARRHNGHVSLLSQQAQTIERLTKALERLANEASGFKSMADPFTHGHTNMSVLGLRIDEARAALTDSTRSQLEATRGTK